jgi:hypothetical protein
MINAACSNTSPFMFDITEPVLRDERPSGSEYLHRQSPLRIDNPYKVFCPPQELKASFDIFRNAFHAFDMLCIEVLEPARAKREADSMELRREATWARLIKPEEDGLEPPITPKACVDEAIRISAKIHFRATAMRIPHNDPVNTADLKRLYTLLRQIDTGFWKVAHYSYLWMCV